MIHEKNQAGSLDWVIRPGINNSNLIIYNLMLYLNFGFLLFFFKKKEAKLLVF